MAHPTVDIELTPRERALILRYGYPFDHIKQALQAVASSQHAETISLEGPEVDWLLGDLCISIRRMEGGRKVQAQLDALCDRIEYALRTGHGELDTF